MSQHLAVLRPTRVLRAVQLLGRFEHEEFEVLAIVMDRHTPFAIVVLQHQRTVAADPSTPVGPRFRHDSSTPAEFGDVVSVAALTERPSPRSCRGVGVQQVRLR
jgi:hypothetical protein